MAKGKGIIKTELPVAITGAGLVGSLLAIFLARKGFKVEVFEKRADPREHKKDDGRSINLAISHRGLSALREVGLEEKVLEQSIPMKGRMMHSEEGELTFQPYGKESDLICSVSRAELNRILISEAEKESGVRFHFENKTEELLPAEKKITLSGKGYDECFYEAIIGTDGAFSTIRKSMEEKGMLTSREDHLSHDYKELVMPAVKGKHAMDKNALHIWPRKQYMLIALPNLDGSFTCTLFLPKEGEYSFSNLDSNEKINAFFENHFADAKALLPDLTEQFQQFPVSSLHTLYAWPWSSGQVLLMGDAAHAIVPFYGQGMNAGFEDVSVFNLMIEQSNSWKECFIRFQQQRKPNTDAIAKMALGNFIEMRDLVADEKFLLRKKIEAALHQAYPDYLNQYAMVTFSSTPYLEAMKKGEQHDQMMKDILGIEGIEKYQEPEVWARVVKRFERG